MISKKIIENLNKPRNIIIGNSTVYFLLACFFVIISCNLFQMLLGIFVGFDAHLYYFGYVLSSGNWSDSNIFMIFFFGNSFSLLTAIISEKIFRRKRKHPSRANMFFLWVYIISLVWFLGNIIIGVFFNFGIGVALRSIEMPFIARLLIGAVAVTIMFFIGNLTRKSVIISSNAYYTMLLKEDYSKFIKNQILWPSILGITLYTLFKFPNMSKFNFLDMAVLSCIAFFILGLFYNRKTVKTFTFKRLEDDFTFSLTSFVLLFVVAIFIRLFLARGLSF